MSYIELTRIGSAVAACAAFAALAGCANRPPAPSLDEIVQMSTEGVADEQIILQLEESRAVYPLTASGIVALEQSGVSTAVLDYMQGAFINHVRRQERLMYGNAYWGYPCVGCRYPYFLGSPYYLRY